MKKMLWLDLETTGLTKEHGIIEIGFVIEIEGEIFEECLFKVRPFPQDLISQQALDITGHTKEEIMSFEEPYKVKKKIFDIFNKYVDKYDKSDKFILAGYNIRSFDFPIFIEWFKKMDEKYFGSYIDFKTKLDVLALLENMRVAGVLPNTRKLKLGEVCEEFGVELNNAHSAIADIIATKELYEKIIKKVLDK